MLLGFGVGRGSDVELDLELLRTRGLSCDDREGAEEDMMAFVKLKLGSINWRGEERE